MLSVVNLCLSVKVAVARISFTKCKLVLDYRHTLMQSLVLAGIQRIVDTKGFIVTIIYNIMMLHMAVK